MNNGLTPEARRMLSRTKPEFSEPIKKEKKKFLVSHANDKSVVELIYDQDSEQTWFAVFKDGTHTVKNFVTINGELYHPLSPSNDLLKHKVILFPSAIEDYQSEKCLIDRIKRYIRKYLEVSPFFETIAAYYVMLSWLYDKFHELPYLRALGDFGTGKTRLLNVIGSICYKPMFVTGATTVSPIFRIISEFKGTLVLDEADFRFSDTTQEITKILNSGFSKGMFVLRTESSSKEYEVKAFDVYGPKIIAGRKAFFDLALESRCLVEKTEKRKRNDIPINLDDKFWKEAQILRNQLLSFRLRKFHQNLRNPKISDTIEPRLQQIITPLLSIISDEETRAKVIEFVEAYDKELKEERGNSLDGDVLFAILVAREENSKPHIKDIADIYTKLTGDDRKPRSLGPRIRKELKLSTNKDRGGYFIENTLANTQQLEALKEKYGYTQEDVNNVNIEDIPWEDTNEEIQEKKGPEQNNGTSSEDS